MIIISEKHKKLATGSDHIGKKNCLLLAPGTKEFHRWKTHLIPPVRLPTRRGSMAPQLGSPELHRRARLLHRR